MHNKALNARPTSWPGQSLLRPFWCMSLRANLHQKFLRSACPLAWRYAQKIERRMKWQGMYQIIKRKLY